MAHYDLEEQEQLDTLKTWWRMYGDLVSGALLLVALCMLAWQGWRWYDTRYNHQAAVLYANLEQAKRGDDMQKITVLAGELTNQYGRSIYATLGVLQAAESSFQGGDSKTASAQLQWASQKGEAAWRDIASLRLAGLLLDEKDYAKALAAVNKPNESAYAAAFADMKGDILFAEGKREAAAEAWQEALKTLQNSEQSLAVNALLPLEDLLQQKIDESGVTAVVADAGAAKTEEATTATATAAAAPAKPEQAAAKTSQPEAGQAAQSTEAAQAATK